MLRDMKFNGGACTEVSRTFYATADDGTVYAFGEVQDQSAPKTGDRPGEPSDAESKGWVVGELQAGDPPDTVPGAEPTVAMPASPGPGSTWRPEDFGQVVEETDRVARAGVLLRVPAGRFRGCIEVEESSSLVPDTETKWYAPGVGFVLARARGMELRLRASSRLRP